MPFKSEAQRGLAHAVAAGKSKAMPKAAAKRLIAHDPGGKLPEKVGRGIAKATKNAGKRGNPRG